MDESGTKGQGGTGHNQGQDAQQQALTMQSNMQAMQQQAQQQQQQQVQQSSQGQVIEGGMVQANSQQGNQQPQQQQTLLVNTANLQQQMQVSMANNAGNPLCSMGQMVQHSGGNTTTMQSPLGSMGIPMSAANTLTTMQPSLGNMSLGPANNTGTLQQSVQQNSNAPAQLQQVQVIGQPYVQQVYNAQGQMLMSGNIALHPNMNHGSIQVITAGKPFSSNQLTTSHVLGKPVLGTQQTSFPGYATIPTTNNQTLVIGQLGVISSQPNILPAHNSIVQGKPDMHKGGGQGGGGNQGGQVKGSGQGGQVVSSVQGGQQTVVSHQAQQAQAQAQQQSQQQVNAQGNVATLQGCVVSQAPTAMLHHLISPIQYTTCNNRGVANNNSVQLTASPWQFNTQIPQVWTAPHHPQVITAQNPIFIRGPTHQDQPMFIQSPQQQGVPPQQAQQAVPVSGKSQNDMKSSNNQVSRTLSILPSSMPSPIRGTTTQIMSKQAQTKLRTKAILTKANLPIQKLDAGNQTKTPSASPQQLLPQPGPGGQGGGGQGGGQSGGPQGKMVLTSQGTLVPQLGQQTVQLQCGGQVQVPTAKPQPLMSLPPPIPPLPPLPPMQPMPPMPTHGVTGGLVVTGLQPQPQQPPAAVVVALPPQPQPQPQPQPPPALPALPTPNKEDPNQPKAQDTEPKVNGPTENGVEKMDTTEVKSEMNGETPVGKPSAEDNKENKGPPKALVKPQVLTHVIEGYVIQESSEPFPISRGNHGTLLTELAQSAKTEKTPTPTPMDADEPPIKKQTLEVGAELGPDKARCETCGKIDLKDKFKKGKRFCSMSCVKRGGSANKRQATGVKPMEVVVPDDEPDTPTAAPAAAQDPAEPNHPLEKWSVTDVVEFIKKLPGCVEYADDFALQEIDGQALLLLKADHLMSAMSMKLGPALKICAKIDSIRGVPPGTPDPPPIVIPE